MEQPTTLIRSPPVQKYAESITEYYYAYELFLFLRTLIKNDSTILADPDKLDMLMNSAIQMKYLTTRDRIDRQSTVPAIRNEFKHTQFLTTYISYYTLLLKIAQLTLFWMQTTNPIFQLLIQRLLP